MILVEEKYKIFHLTQMHSDGTTIFETIIAILQAFFYTSIASILTSTLYNYIKLNKISEFILDIIVIILPCTLGLTVFAQHLQSVLIVLCILMLIMILIIYNINVPKITEKNIQPKTYFITNARATVNVLSVIAILAVDFKIFPRKFAKTENFGYSLMDTGVGLYIYSNGIVAPETMGRSDSIKRSLKNSLPLFLLGIIRFICTQKIDYNVPVTEYGIHWNFFITLAVTKVFTSFILTIFKIDYIHINAFLLILAHETLLQTGLQNFVLQPIKRDNFLKANREGIFSSLGYISLYLLTVYFGYLLRKTKSKFETIVLFTKGTILTFALSIIFQFYLGISRKLANAAYCFWILSIGFFMTGLYFVLQVILDYIFGHNRSRFITYSPLIFEAVNYNGLAFFLIANLLTGLINLNLNTLEINDSVSLAIVILYMIVNCLIVSILYSRKIKLKL